MGYNKQHSTIIVGQFGLKALIIKIIEISSNEVINGWVVKEIGTQKNIKTVQRN